MTRRAQLEAEREELTQVKDEFIAIASHDLKAPLTTVLAGATLVCDMVPPGTPMSASCHQLLQRIAANGEVMKQIVEDFLDFQALEDRQIRLDLEPTRVADLLQDVMGRLKDYARRNEVRVSLEPAAGLGVCGMDRHRVAQVTMNLLHNAIKFSPPGTKVELRARRVDDQVEVQVCDQGPGLRQDDMQRLFTKYARLSVSATSGEKSSGLGLAICKQLVQLHGGDIGARNNDEQGATFWFHLPAHPAGSARAAATQTSERESDPS